jgi:PAS domain S-box-containing protein
MSQRPAHLVSSDRRHRRDAALAPLRAVAEAVTDGIVCADATGHITLWTGGAADIFGLSADEAIGRPLTEFMPERLRARHAAGFARVAAGEDPALLGKQPLEVPALRRDGTEFPAELTLSRGELEGEPFFVGVVRDVTARRDAERELGIAQERFRSAFEHAAIGMTMSSVDGRYVSVNPAFCRLVGRVPEELEGLAPAEITHPDDRAADRMAADRLLAGGASSVRLEKRYVRPEGTTVWVDASISLVRDAEGRPQHYLTQAQDVTERRRSAEELQRSNAALAHFAHMASHDLREPLRIVDGFLQLLRTRSGDTLGEDGLRFVAHALTGTARMRELIESFLRYAESSREGLGRESLALDGLARQAVTSLGAAIAERRVRVVVDDLPAAEGDPALVRQVLQNLIGNAIRHAPHESACVRVGAQEHEDFVEVSVSDNGPGVPADQRERVFQMFVGGEGGGSGLGLAICRRVVERHGGRIWIQEASEGGADVRFTLPRPGGAMP